MNETAMRTIPILFTGEMVRAILDGRKTQTRRIVKPQPHELISDFHELGRHGWKPAWAMREFSGKIGGEDHGAAQAEWEAVSFGDENRTRRCPYGQPGDHLYVRERFWEFGSWQRIDDKRHFMPYYGLAVTDRRIGAIKFGDAHPEGEYDINRAFAWHRRPGIFLPKPASHTTLLNTGVRVERVQEITEADAMAEGVNGGCLTCGNPDPCGCDDPNPDYRESFIYLWESINAKRGYSWESNPWVWVVEFERLTP